MRITIQLQSISWPGTFRDCKLDYRNTNNRFLKSGGGQVMMKRSSGSLTASQIIADAINGNHIAATGIIQAGSGAANCHLNGSDANWRIYAGSLLPVLPRSV